jgi:hypothetical protein
MQAKSARAIYAAIILKTGHAQARQAVAVDEPLPRQELFKRDRIALACFLEAEHAGADCGDDFGLAADDPTLGLGWRQAVERDAGADVDEPIGIAFAELGLRAVNAGWGYFGLHDGEAISLRFKKALRDVVNALKDL